MTTSAPRFRRPCPIVAWALTALLAGAACAGEAQRAAKPVPDAENDLDVAYRPERLVDRPEDRLVRMNVHWPKGDGRHPCVLVVHGGGYDGGDKDGGGGGGHEVVAALARRGYVVANLNYILGRGIFPQVYHDYKAAVRFLRANAERYRIDPDRLGAWGFSAGGWLTTSAGFSSAGDIFVDQKATLAEAWPPDDPRGASARKAIERAASDRSRGPFLAVPMDEPEPAHGGHSARLQAVFIDYSHNQAIITGEDPAIGTYVGTGGVSVLQAPALAAGVDYAALVLPGEKAGSSAVHVPDLRQQVPAADGRGQQPLMERVIDWFDERLRRDPRTPAPELRPNLRVFAESVRVTAVTTSPDIEVRYTVDGSEPTASSPRWSGPLELNASTVVSAAAFKAGMRPSGVAVARFVRGEPPPTITGPERLPIARVGAPFEARFAIAGDRVPVWRLEAQTRSGNAKPSLAESVGIAFDAGTGTLSGKPTRAGVYTLHVQVAWGPGQPASSRAWALRVDDG